MPNRLQNEKSPYLLQHAHNPVDWWPWTPEARETARRLDRPLFLSIGYSACHWCHVMERESFEDEAIAARLNERFVCIKVDREERPDIDEIYMTAVQMMTGQGGWPLSVFLTPEGKPFYGGTYFPPQSRGGRIGFGSLVEQLGDAWKSRRDEVEQVAQSIVADLEKATRQRPLAGPDGAIDPAARLRAAREELAGRFDPVHGGFGGAPKFPPHHALRLLCLAIRAGTDGESERMLTTTLDRMALGGIYDQVGGGFHRYSTDAVWLLPHFEKMLYDNALLARVYAEAGALTGRAAYARIARETCDWVLRDLADPGGGFQAALDADSEGEEGKYYVWTRAEAEAVAGRAFCDRYHLAPAGNFREEATGRATGACIPYLAVEAAEVPLPEALGEETVAARERLRAARAQRMPPGRDDKVIAGWNGLMIGALAVAGKTLEELRYLEAARRAAGFCLTTLSPEGQLHRRFARGEAAVPGFLDDFAYLADGLIDLYEATGEARWREAALALADDLLARFWDEEEGGFFFASGDRHERLIARSKDLFDGALPSANGVAARALARLGGPYRARARTLLVAYHGALARAPQGMATLIGAAADAFPPGEAAGTTLAAISPALTVAPGEAAVATFRLALPEGWHINARRPGRNDLVATIASIASDLPAALGPVAYPVPSEREVSGERLMVYEGTVAFDVPVVVANDAAPGEYTLTLTVRYQPCGPSSCLPPEERSARVDIRVAG